MKKPEHEIGCDLSLLSVDELQKRITLLEQEIERLKMERDSKKRGKMAAEALFRGSK
ncbi:uncharacterized small protein (DUF1192 family) [Agrobacterium vitis]|nr:uncharacterized small protein (DUF1192 family) [Agrobacterium vitis]